MVFNPRQKLLAQRVVLLRARSSVARDELQQALNPLTPALQWADRMAAGWRWLAAHPGWLAGATALLAVSRPRRAWRLGLRLWGGWRLWLRLRRWQASVAPWVWPQIRQILARRFGPSLGRAPGHRPRR